MTIALHGATVDLVARLVHRDDADDPVRLTRTEARLLAFFIDNPNRLLTQEQLLVDVWELHPKTRTATVYVTVNRLRKKIERDPKQPAHVTNSPGAGYLFRPLAVVASDPSRTGPLVGRDVQLQRLGNAARRSGVVVVRGPAGVGKTRLVEAFLTGRRNPSWRVPLGDTSDADGVVAAVARALGVQPGPSVLVSLSSVLASLERSTLVLDDVDRAATALPGVLDTWLDAAPDLRVVVTTRRRIVAVEERAKVLVLEPLDPESAALLLRDRSPNADLDESTVGRWVSELGGNPLAIEIAARSLGGSDPPDALDLLPGDRLDRAIRKSWELLDRHQQTLLAAVAGFQAPFTLESAAAVLDQPSEVVAERLQGLVDHGLAAPAALSDSPRPRLSLPSPVRAFAREHAAAHGTRLEWRRRHARWFATAEPGPWSREVRDDRRVEQPDCEQAESVLVEGLEEEGADGSVAAALVDLMMGQVEAAMRLGPVEPLAGRIGALLDRPGWSPDQQARLVHGLARLLGVVGRYDEAVARLTGVLDIHGDALQRGLRAILLRERGHHRCLGFALDAAEADLQHALSEFEALETPAEMGRCATVLGIVAFNRGDRDMASRWLEQAVDQLEEPDPEGWAQAATRLAMVVQQHGDAARARALLADVTSHCEAVGDAVAGMTARAALAICLVGAGDRRGGVAMHEDVLARARRLGDLHREASTRYNLGSLLAADDEVGPARKHLGRALELFEQLGNQRSIALTHSALGTLERSEGNAEAACAHLEPGLALALEGGWKGLVVSLASSLALVAARAGDDEAVDRHLSVATEANEGLNMPFVSASLCCRRAIVACWQGDDAAASRWVARATQHADDAGKRDSSKFEGMLGAVEAARVAASRPGDC